MQLRRSSSLQQSQGGAADLVAPAATVILACMSVCRKFRTEITVTALRDNVLVHDVVACMLGWYHRCGKLVMQLDVG